MSSHTQTVYGPVKSWRFGQSLGIDPIFHVSTCSFNCIYCQLGAIVNVGRDYKEYVATEQVLRDLDQVLNRGEKIDVITYSGSGEPTLASNLEAIIKDVKVKCPKIPQYILTNATEMGLPAVQSALRLLDKVIVKIDASNEEIFQKVNRPAAGITLHSVLENIVEFKKTYTGQLEVQTMFMPLNSQAGMEALAEILKQIGPTVVQLNTPKRPYPMKWQRENRGNHSGIFHCEVRQIKGISEAEAKVFESELRKLTGLPILSVYH